MALDNNTPWAGLSGDKLYLNSGEFLTTMITSLSISGTDTTPLGISWDGIDTPWAGNVNDKMYLQSGQFYSTLKTSRTTPTGKIAGIADENGNTMWADFISEKLMLDSGRFTTTVKSSLNISTQDVNCRGIDWDGTNTPWSGQTSKKFFLQSGKFSSTLKTSKASPNSEQLFGMAYTGVNTLSTTEDTDKFYSTAGQFTSTILDSYDVTTIDTNQAGVAHTARIGWLATCELNAEDFEDALTGSWSSTGVTLEAGEGYASTQGAYFNASPDKMTYVFPVALWSLYIGFWFRTDSTSATVQELVSFNGSSALPQTTLAIQDSTGDITVRRQSSPTIGTASGTNVSDGDWHFIEIYNKIDNVSGAMIVYLDDVEVIDIGPVDTQVSGGSVGILEMFIAGHAVTSERWVDDFYLDRCAFHGSPFVPPSNPFKFVGLSFSYGRSSGGFVA